jgi:glycerol-3-phosphate acyltransferase PlsY
MNAEALPGALALAIGGYLLGSIPVAWLITRVHLGKDLRTLGSGNVGVLNTALSVHRWAGLLVFLTEIAKGVVAVLVARQLAGNDVATAAAALGAFVGTRWPVWLRFRGGRGNTVAASSLAVIAPLAVLALAVLWLSVRLVGRTNFTATRVMLGGLPLALGVATWSVWWAAVGLCYAALFLTTHSEGTDDHLIARRQYRTLGRFLMTPRRKGHPIFPRRLPRR